MGVLWDPQCQGFGDLLELCMNAWVQVPRTWKHFCQPSIVSVKFINVCVSHNRACQNIHAWSPFFVRNSVQVVRHFGFSLTEVWHQWYRAAILSLFSYRVPPWKEAEVSLIRSQWKNSHGIPTVSEQREQHKVFLRVLLHWMQRRHCERHRWWFVLYNWIVSIYLFIFLNNFRIWR